MTPGIWFAGVMVWRAIAYGNQSLLVFIRGYITAVQVISQRGQYMASYRSLNYKLFSRYWSLAWPPLYPFCMILHRLWHI